MSRSSRSTNDMWQPEQPPSQAVAMRGLLAAGAFGVTGSIASSPARS